MRISRTDWLASAASNRSPRHMQSLCYLIANGAGFSAKERYLAERLLRKMDGVVQEAIAERDLLQAIIQRFMQLETQVSKRLDLRSHQTGPQPADLSRPAESHSSST